MINVDAAHLGDTISSLAKDVGGWCSAASVFIGEVDGKPVRVEVLRMAEAVEEHDYEGTAVQYNCLESKYE